MLARCGAAICDGIVTLVLDVVGRSTVANKSSSALPNPPSEWPLRLRLQSGDSNCRWAAPPLAVPRTSPRRAPKDRFIRTLIASARHATSLAGRARRRISVGASMMPGHRPRQWRRRRLCEHLTELRGVPKEITAMLSWSSPALARSRCARQTAGEPQPKAIRSDGRPRRTSSCWRSRQTQSNINRDGSPSPVRIA